VTELFGEHGPHALVQRTAVMCQPPGQVAPHEVNVPAFAAQLVWLNGYGDGHSRAQSDGLHE
jgi:hypothetical protein